MLRVLKYQLIGLDLEFNHATATLFDQQELLSVSVKRRLFLTNFSIYSFFYLPFLSLLRWRSKL
jgi:predicted neutral ceramidase superfamily lipid hydrolase